ncbi:hypothetical protein KPA96_19375 [Burkholderia cenocepacia]|uniref:hypothetical protein n=1 Tax=Burkholderia cenocepacia TaxID=95486 RepID=UPI002854E265|nr:hypothetical protein [Burkholderia cenocepacia]MDR8077819.1 hypothetical protein [Burkholderia cenocepacia]
MQELIDDFHGDDAALVRNIKALIDLNDSGALVPHGIGGHARGMLSAAAVRLTSRETLTAAARDVLAERRRQVDVEGFTPEHDDEHNTRGEIPAAAGSYALHAFDRRIAYIPAWWPWRRTWWKPGTPRQMLVKAGALILAAIEQIDRRAAK